MTSEKDANTIHKLFLEFHYADDLGVIKSKLAEYVATARKEEREAAFKEAAKIVAELPIRVSRLGVKKGSDLNGWSSAINQAIGALLEAAATENRKGEG